MPAPIIVLLAALIVIPVGIIAVLYLVVPLFKGIGWVLRQVFRFIGGEIGDTLRFGGAVITQIFLLPLVIVNVLIGRWSAAGHYGRAVKGEFKAMAACFYRMGVGHPARLLCLTALTDGLEKRLPQVVAAAPTSDKPSLKTTGQFEGYTIIGSLPGGGSGGKLYVAQPDAMKLAIYARNGRPDVRQVVIKTFSLRDGSSLPQIVRESRALEAAKRLGLVLEHELTDERFYYVTQYMPGESLGLVTQRLHAVSGGDGLGAPQLHTALTYGSDLLRTLDTYHRGGLWHKDVKPDNIIVDGTAAHLVDFGLVTPLRSGMTLTTHGTEYFRDPEMVRLALKGVKVHQVDGAKFDIYAAGAVLFSMIENSFPAHGGLSQISRRCPEALNWIVRRAMADYDKRYPNASAMLADLDAVRAAPDPFALKPIELPSMRGTPAVEIPDEAPIRPVVFAAPVGAGSDTPRFAAAGAGAAFAGSPEPRADRARPKIRVNRWWSGGYIVDGHGEQVRNSINDAVGHAHRAVTTAMAGLGLGGFGRPPVPPPASAQPWMPRNPGVSAQDQIKSARGRVQAARERARARMAARRGKSSGDFNTMNAGVAVAVFLFLAVCVGVAAMMFMVRRAGPVMGQTPEVEDHLSPGLTYASINLPEFPEIPGHPADAGANTPEPRSIHTNASLPGPRIVVNGKVYTRDGKVVAPTQTVPPPHVFGQKALIVSDIVPLTSGMTAAISRLHDAGFVVLGNYPGNTATADEAKAQDELAAAARSARNVGPLTAPDVSEMLSEWVAEQEDLSLLVWFAKSDPEKSAVNAYLFSPKSDSARVDQTELQAAMSALRPR